MTPIGRKRVRRFAPAVARHVIPGALALAVLAALSARAPAEEPGLKVLAFGDSLIHGYGLAAGATFPERLEAALGERGYHVQVVNGGNSGDTTASGRARLQWALVERPDAVLLELGGNDGLRGLEPSSTYANLDAILARLAAEGLPVLFAGMRAPRNLGPDYAAEFDAVFTRLAEKHDVMFYPFFLDGVALDPALNQADGIHPNRAGIRVLVERILPSMVRLIDKARARRRPPSGRGADG